MTGMPPGRPSEPRTGPAAPAPAHGARPTGPSAPTGRTALRDQIIERAAEWAYAYPISSNAICQTDDRAWRLARIWGEQIARIAVMPVVEAETAALRQRIEEVEDQRDQALAWQDTAERERDEERAIRQQTEEALAIAHDTSNRSERARQAAERALAQARDAIADERRGRLAAEAAVRRVKHVLAWKTLLAGPQAEKAVRVADVEAALDAEQPKETP